MYGERMDGNHPHKPRLMTAEAREQTEQRLLRSIQESFPGWDVCRVFGGWRAVPRQTPVIEAIDLHGIIEKLTEHTQGPS